MLKPFSFTEAAKRCNLVFLSLPHTVSHQVAPQFLKAGKRVIDVSADYRLKDTAVVFVNFYKTKRGHYHFTCTLATTEPNGLREGELTEMFVRYVETCVSANPANYLWSHRRWKHAWKEEYARRWVCSQQPVPAPDAA